MTNFTGMVSEFDCPTWAVNFVVNGDSTGMTHDEVAVVEQFCEHMDCFSVSEDAGEFFSWHPAFGDPCTCVEVTFRWMNGDWESNG